MKRIEKRRYTAILTMFMLLFIFLSIRLYFLQVHPTERVEAQYKNHQTEVISDNKYMLLDTNGKDLMEYKKNYVLVVDSKPFRLNNYEETLEDLMALNFIMKGEDENFNYTDIIKSDGKTYYNISEETYNKIKKLYNIKGIYTFVRDNIDSKEAWSTSGMFSKIKENDLSDNSIQKEIYDITKNNEIPKKNFYLDEKATYSLQELDINKENKNIKLTIDKEIENKIRKVLSKEEYKKFKNIGVTIIESDTGKIRGLVQKNESEGNINLGIGGIGYEPGSIFKLITYGVALEEGLVSPHSTVYCSGDMCGIGSHGKITLNNGLVKSCNDVFGVTGNKIGYDKLMEYCDELGLFKEVIGYKEKDKNETNGVKPKKEDQMSLISIGQSMNTSPIQMIGAINALINNGVYVKPYILEGVVDLENNTIKTYSSKKERVFTETTSKIIKNGMKEVVSRGTGMAANNNIVQIGGKTGSATSSNGTTHGWFSGFFEANNKKYTMIVFIPDLSPEKDEDLGGGNTAAPIFKDIALEIKK